MDFSHRWHARPWALYNVFSTLTLSFEYSKRLIPYAIYKHQKNDQYILLHTKYVSHNEFQQRRNPLCFYTPKRKEFLIYISQNDMTPCWRI